MSDRQDWLAERRKGLGASEAAAVLGMNPHRTPIEVWIDKVHPELASPRQDEDFLEFGTELEAPIERRYIRDTGNQVYHPSPAIIVHPKYPEILCTPDGLCDSPERIVVEYKFERYSDGFGDQGTDEIPEHFLVQGCHQMACTDRNRADFGVLHGAPPIRVYRAYRDLELEKELIDRLRAWWADYVVKDIEPPVDSSHAWSQYLARKYPKNRGEMLKIEAGSPIEGIFEFYLEDKALLEKVEARLDMHKNELKAYIADNDGLLFSDGSAVTYRKDKDSVKDVIDWESIARGISDILKTDLNEFWIPNHIQKGVITRHGARKLLVKEPKCLNSIKKSA